MQSYRYLATIVDTIDKMVKKISMGGYFYNRKSNSTTMSQFETIIDLNERKQRLTNLKVIVEETFVKLSSKDLELLSLYYIDGLTFDEISKVKGVSIRTIFRRNRLALDKFTNNLANVVTVDYLHKYYSSESWIMELYDYNVAKSQHLLKFKQDDQDDYDGGRQVFKALKELRRIAI